MPKSSNAAAETEAASRSTYFKDYYAGNRDSINRNRKRRYHNDPDYKAAVLMASQRYRENHRPPPKIRVPRYSAPMVADIGGGGQIRLFSVGAFAIFLSRSVQAITHWEKGGVLPPTPYRDSRGHRYYTRSMMAKVRDVVGDRRRLFPIDGIHDAIREGWIGLGVPMSARSMKDALAKTKLVDETSEEED